MRVTARETAFKVIFASNFTGEISRGTARALYKSEKLTEDDILYANTVLNLVEDHWNEYSAIIDRLSRSFPEVRIFPADRSIMLLSLAEIYGMEDVPDTVSVNEAANIASKYSSEKSASFVSGILGEAIKEKNSPAKGQGTEADTDAGPAAEPKDGPAEGPADGPAEGPADGPAEA
ncbi:MAG: transcription antitermination protein NusB [Clostridia bacterium]|nr:transcription antitermination protein NusB [Clostridia bacterium]